MNYWLMKSEPDVFSIDHLAALPGKKSSWEGVRNYQARNFMKQMQIGDQAFFYHSSADVIGIAGIVRITGLAEPDLFALDKKSDYHDPKATKDKNPWVSVTVTLVRKFKKVITLAELRETKGLEKMLVLQRGMRLSVHPVTEKEFKIVSEMAK
ncbi:MAG: EVE domain-containing protein [Leptospirales bacterium]|nr:EVE domain-containing protein [Leptospirales bacterium]